MQALPHLENVFPKLLAAGYEKTSEETGRPPRPGAYNCVAWAAHDTHNWWWPDDDDYWPRWAKRELTISSFVKAFRWLGYRECNNSRFEFGYEKVALYAMHSSGEPATSPVTIDNLHDWEPRHMARQLPDGTWTSKAGELEDFTHFTLDAVESYEEWEAGYPSRPGYGSPVLFMKRLIFVSWIVRILQSAHWELYDRWRA